MKTDLANANSGISVGKDSLPAKPVDDHKVIIGVRRTLQPLQQTAGRDKENLVGAGRSSMAPNREKMAVLADPKPPKKLKAAEFRRGSTEEPKAGSRLIIAKDLTSDDPSAAYWEALAERRRIALADALKDNQRLMEKIAILEKENSLVKSRLACLEDENSQANVVLNEARETINILSELLKEKDDSADCIDLDGE